MCDATPLRNYLLGILAAIAAAVSLVAVAAITNNSFWSAGSSPVWMLLAAGSSALAALLCGYALDELDTLGRCSGERCAGQCNNMRNVLRGAKTVLGVQAAACAGVAAYAWIPWAASASMYVILGALLCDLALIVSAIWAYSTLASCISTTTVQRQDVLRQMLEAQRETNSLLREMSKKLEPRTPEAAGGKERT